MLSLTSKTEKNDELRRPLNELRVRLFILVILILLASVGYWLIELRPRGKNFLESIYFVIVTLSPTGYADLIPISTSGKVFVTVLIIVGLVVLAWAGGTALAYFLEGHFTEEVKWRKMKRGVEEMANHYILCGLGRVGTAVLEEFRRADSSFVVVDADSAVLSQVLAPSELYVIGKSTDDTVLKEAGVERAKGLVTCMPDDADNVFTVLSAKAINPGLFIISRAEAEETRSKLFRAGANRVVLSSRLSGERIAAMALRPAVVDFLDRTVTVSGEEPLLIEEVTLGSSSPLVGQSLRQANIKTQTEVMVLGVKSRGGEMTINPTATLVLNEGDTLVGIGRERDFQSLCQLARGRDASE